MNISRSYKDLVNINNAVNESVDSLIRDRAEKDFRKEVVDVLKEEFDFSKEEIKLFKIAVIERYKTAASAKIVELEEGVAYNDNLLDAELKLKSVSRDDVEDEVA